MGAATVAAPAARTELILDAMESRLCDGGIRSVVMSDLARELGMSTKTLYRSFASKETLVEAVVDRWAERLLEARQRRRESDMSVTERVRTAAWFLVQRRDALSPAFWQELESDHPDAWARYLAMLDASRRASDEWMARSMRPGLDVTTARALLTASIERALDPELRDAAGLNRQQAVELAVDIWSRGVFVDPDAPPPAAPD